jgi:glycosyltransferase involved in cell wall biosynthesis
MLTLERSWRRNVFDAARFVHAHRAPVVHYHLSDDFLDPAFIRAMDLLRPPAAFGTMHSPYDRLPEGPNVMRRWARAADRHFRRIICVSAGSRQRQVRNGVPADRTTLIYNGIDVARFASGSAAAAWRALPDVPPGSRLILSTARLDEQKQPVAAVEAFARIARDFPEVHLVLTGRGPLEEATRAAATEAGVDGRVHLVGHQSNVPDWLAAAAVWLLPTLGEGFSMAVIEAMAAGCAIVSTWCAGNDEVLEDDLNALTVPVRDVDALAGALRRVLGDPSLAARLGAAAQTTAARYSLEVVVDRHLECYGLPRVATGARHAGALDVA